MSGFLDELFSAKHIGSGGLTLINDQALRALGQDENTTLGALNEGMKHGPLEESITKGRPVTTNEALNERNKNLDRDKSGNAKTVAGIAGIVGAAFGGAALAGGSAGGAGAAGGSEAGAGSVAAEGSADAFAAEAAGGADVSGAASGAPAEGSADAFAETAKGAKSGNSLGDWGDLMSQGSPSSNKPDNSAQKQSLQAQADSLRSQIAALQARMSGSN
jgi:hypothetical protein